MSKIQLICKTCDKPFYCWPSEMKRGRKYCSHKCSEIGYVMSQEAREKARHRRIKRNKEYPISSDQARKNASKSSPPIGRKHYRWKGGQRKKSDGRMLIFAPNHPFADKRGYVLRSHLVMEKKIGRYLLPNEVVHHINKNNIDDCPENLHLFSNTGDHTKLHHHQGDIHKQFP